MRQRGFTLLEVLVAIAIFALMYVMAQQFFSRILTDRDLLDDKARVLEARQRALLVLVQDFEQLIARPVRDKLGDLEPALVGNSQGVEFTHLGWANPFSLQQRSNMQRVRYVFYDHQLVRRYWPVLDANVGTRPVDTVLLDKVDSVQFRYLKRDADTGQWLWLERWPDDQNAQTSPLLQPLPVSVEVTIRMESGESLHRYFRLVINPWENNT
jgi:general secretion pathway protein J